MERVNKKDYKKAKVNRIISYVWIAFSIVVLAFCISQIIRYVVQVRENNVLTRDLETLKQDSNYLRDHFDVLKNEDYYSVYVDGDYQYVDSKSDSIVVIK